jgi:hypothetical protein
LDVTIKNNRLEQRAWITISVDAEGWEIAETEPVSCVVHVKNIGKTIAKKFEQNVVITVVPSDQRPNFSYPYKSYKTTTGILNPNDPFDRKILMLSRGGGILDPPKLTKTQLEDLKAGKAYILAFGRIAYRDIYRVDHWVQFCTARTLVKGEYNYRECTEFNDVDDN